MNAFRRIAVVAFLMSCIAATLFAAPAGAALKSWTVRVIKVNDGDTFDVDRNFDGSIDYRVRLIGINTPEGHWKWSNALQRRIWVTPERPKCQSWYAYRRLRGLVEGKRVVLKAADFDSIGTGSRKLRFVHRISDGKDINALLLREGLAVAYPNQPEPSRNADYNRLAKTAANRGIGLWNPFACANDGPARDAKLRVRARWVVDSDSRLNDEYVRVQNLGAQPVSLKGWVLRESSTRYYFFEDVNVLAGGSITVHSGAGVDDTDSPAPKLHKHVYAQHAGNGFDFWSRPDDGALAQERTVFGHVNASRPGYRDRQNVRGDGAYLYDPHRDLRAWMTYPCLTSTNKTCADPTLDSRDISVDVDWKQATLDGDGESVTLTNTSRQTIDLSGYMVDSWPWNTEIARGAVLAPGERYTIHILSAGSGPLEQTWNGPTHRDMFFCKAGERNDYLELRRMEGHVAVRWQCFG